MNEWRQQLHETLLVMPETGLNRLIKNSSASKSSLLSPSCELSSTLLPPDLLALKRMMVHSCMSLLPCPVFSSHVLGDTQNPTPDLLSELIYSTARVVLATSGGLKEFKKGGTGLLAAWGERCHCGCCWLGRWRLGRGGCKRVKLFLNQLSLRMSVPY